MELVKKDKEELTAKTLQLYIDRFEEVFAALLNDRPITKPTAGHMWVIATYLRGRTDMLIDDIVFFLRQASK